MQESKTTPTPWLLDSIFGNIVMNDEDNKVIAYTQTRDKYFAVEVCKANAAFIVQAVNCHEALVEALEHCRKDIVDHEFCEEGDPLVEIIDAALAKAKEESVKW